jgi:hypothetical protein
LISDILDGDPDDEFYDAKVKVLSEEIKHHVQEEEQRNGMFAQARRGDVDLKALGQALTARKVELQETFKAEGLPAPQTRTMRGPPNLEFAEPISA